MSLKDADEYFLEHSVFSGTDAHEMTLGAGEALTVEVISERGRLSLMIGMEGEDYIYRGNGLSASRFSVTAEKGGAYRIEVAGEGAKGSVRIRKETADED